MKTFTFDLNQIEDESFVKPAGIYICQIEDIDDSNDDSKGNPRIIWRLNILKPQNMINQSIKDGISIIEPNDKSKGTMWIVKKIYKSCNFKEIPTNWAPKRDWAGKIVKCIVTVGTYINKDGEKREQNRIQYEMLDNDSAINATGIEVKDDLPF